ncbi:hypothetical protein KP509_27G061100 [Ceratopteris richardii]|uniref:Late embryogenesis abundant protein LEA-2 subgroup domain-containing protein n=1 Tax=Ceratopteris richardii TaxID=49495 RepID=A0A8T2RJF1_CERRI|nr:hypothetical protein KP509_27G061100 [Ceratopteris richardii]
MATPASKLSEFPHYSPLTKTEEPSDLLIVYPSENIDDNPPPPSLTYSGMQRHCCGYPLNRRCIYACICYPLLVFVGLCAFFFWPRGFDVDLEDISLGDVDFDVDLDGISLNITLDLELQADNSNFFGISYDNVALSLYYDEDLIGTVESSGGQIGARRKSSFNVSLSLSGDGLISNVITFIEDLANGSIPLRTAATFDGDIDILFFRIPLEKRRIRHPAD